MRSVLLRVWNVLVMIVFLFSVFGTGLPVSAQAPIPGFTSQNLGPGEITKVAAPPEHPGLMNAADYSISGAPLSPG